MKKCTEYKSLTPGHRKILRYLDFWFTYNAYKGPLIANIKIATRLSESWILRSLPVLESFGYVRIIRHRDGSLQPGGIILMYLPDDMEKKDEEGIE